MLIWSTMEQRTKSILPQTFGYIISFQWTTNITTQTCLTRLQWNSPKSPPTQEQHLQYIMKWIQSQPSNLRRLPLLAPINQLTPTQMRKIQQQVGAAQVSLDSINISMDRNSTQL